MTTFALAGFGHRAAAFHRVAQALPELRCVGAVVRAPHRRSLPVAAFGGLAQCVREARPDFLVTAVPSTANPAIITDAVAHDLPVLAETPPPADVHTETVTLNGEVLYRNPYPGIEEAADTGQEITTATEAWSAAAS